MIYSYKQRSRKAPNLNDWITTEMFSLIFFPKWFWHRRHHRSRMALNHNQKSTESVPFCVKTLIVTLFRNDSYCLRISLRLSSLKGICNFPINIISNLPYEYMYTGQTQGIDGKQSSKLTGLITIPDVKAQEIETENGKVIFVEFIGVTDEELKAILNRKIRVRELYEKLGTDITDYSRDSMIFSE